MSIRIDAASFAKAFPKSIPVPQRLVDLAAWLKKEKLTRGALGWFDALGSEKLDVTYTDNEAATEVLRASLGIFLSLPDGSRLALWSHGQGSPAVVLLGSEGELENVADDLDAFLLAWSKAKTNVNDLDEDDDDAGSGRPLLAKWLAAQGVKPAKRKVPSFKAWFEDTVEANESPAKKKSASKAATAALAKADPLAVDLASVKKHAGSGVKVGADLERLAKWLAKAPEFGLAEEDIAVRGYPHSFTNDDRIDALLKPALAFFLNVPAGDIESIEIGLWSHGAKGAAPAVVAFGPKETWRTLAPDLASFATAWSGRATGLRGLDRGGDDAWRAKLGAVLESKSAGSPARAPDVAQWVKTATASAKAATAKLPKVAVGKRIVPPADMAARVEPLVGKQKNDATVVTFFRELGIDLPSITADNELNRLFVPDRGYSLSFRVPKGTTSPRVFDAVRFHRAKNRFWSYVLGRDVSFAEYPSALPRGITFTSTRAELVALLGKPTKDDDGDLQWKNPNTKVTLGVDFASEWDKIPKGEMKSVWLAVL